MDEMNETIYFPIPSNAMRILVYFHGVKFIRHAKVNSLMCRPILFSLRTAAPANFARRIFDHLDGGKVVMIRLDCENQRLIVE
jgi:hypothetical protein